MLASGADIAALQAATASVYGELERDPLTRGVIARIRELKQRLGADTVAPTACGEPIATLPNAKATSALDGVYRVEVTEAKLRAQGIEDSGIIEEITGVYTYTFKGGRYCEVFKPKTNSPNNNNPDYVPGQCSTYAVDGDRIIMRSATEPPTVSRWSLTTRGDLRFSPTAATRSANVLPARSPKIPGSGSAADEARRRFPCLLATPALAGCFDGGSGDEGGRGRTAR